MSLLHSSVLDRMDKLKKWQEQQEQVLQQHHKRVNKTNSLEGDALQTVLIESRAIIPQTSIHITPEHTTPKVKKQFLRRGSGLSRFKMTPGEQFRTLSKNKSTRETSFVETATPQHPIQTKAMWSSPSSNANSSLLLFEEIEKRLKDNSIDTPKMKVCPSSSTPAKKLPHERYNCSNRTQQKLLFSEEPSDGLYDDIVEKNRQVMQENKKQLEDMEQYEKRLQEELLSSLQQAIKFKELLQDKAVGDSHPVSLSSSIKDFDDLEKWGSNESLNSVSTVSSAQVMNDVVKYDVATMTEVDVAVECNLLDTEHIQKSLQQELKVVQDQNNEVNVLKKQLEYQSREFEKERKIKLKQLENDREALARSCSAFEQDKKKLAKEKMVFERYVKDHHNKPNKKEREEISVLREELVTLKETFKLKEVKNSTLQARLRNHIKGLEKENSELKTQIERLTKENGRLIATQRLAKKPSDTKLLHEINKNITKLTHDHLNAFNEKQQGTKENDKNNSNSSDADNRSVTEKITTIFATHCKNSELHIEDSKEGSTISNRIEEVMSDGSKVVTYSNGNVKTTSSDGNIVKFKYNNGDIKTTNLLEGTICYYFFQTKVSHTTKADGTEIIEYQDGQTETRYKDRTSELKYPNGITVVINEQGDRILSLPNGQKEIHTKDHKRREYPDGTVKILYPDGQQETRYSNGRVRIKDTDGNLLFDSLG